MTPDIRQFIVAALLVDAEWVEDMVTLEGAEWRAALEAVENYLAGGSNVQNPSN